MLLERKGDYRDTYTDYRSAGDPRHVYSRDVWERRKNIGIDMYD